MYVAMLHRLASSFASIDGDVKSGDGRVRFLDFQCHCFQEFIACVRFWAAEFEYVGMWRLGITRV